MQQNNIIFLYAIFNFLECNRITFNNQRELKKKKKTPQQQQQQQPYKKTKINHNLKKKN